MNKINKLFPRKSSYAGAPVKNRAGSKAFKHDIFSQALQALMVGNLEGTYYAGARELSRETLDILDKAGTKDPLFLAQALIFARNEGYLRISPIVGLLILSKKDPVLFRRVFDEVIRQPGDLQDFLTLVRGGSVRGMGRTIRTAAGSWLQRISPYHIIKYGAPQKKPGENTPLNLRDMLRVVRPTPPSAEVDYLFKYIVDRIRGASLTKAFLRKLPEQLQAYEKFKELTAGGASNEKAALDLVAAHKLPYEVVTSRLNTPETWKVLARTAPFMNMLRNLNNYEKNGVFKDQDILDRVIDRLTNEEQIARSKQFPFRFYAAYRRFSGNSQVHDALAEALDISVGNIPDLGRTLIAVDESGSMDHPISDRSEVTMRNIGNIFAAALYKHSRKSILVPFTHCAYPLDLSESDLEELKQDQHRRVNRGGYYSYHRNQLDPYVDGAYRALKKVNRRDSTVSVAEALAGINGGTDLAAPLDYALSAGREFDTGIFITDSESWHDHVSRGHGVLDSIRKFRRKNPKAQFFFIQLAQNNKLQTPAGEPGVHYIYGWSDNVLKYIAQAAGGGDGQMEQVRALVLPVPTVAKRKVETRKKAVKRKTTKRKAVKKVKAKRRARLR